MADDHTVPRWEWRAFGADFSDIDAILTTVPSVDKSSEETYLLCATPGVNAKVRHDVLDIKRLHAARDGLELWSPVFKATFPLHPWQIREAFSLWHLSAPPLPHASYAWPLFLSEVVASTNLVPVHVRKTRRQGSLDGCTVELSTVTVRDRGVLTAAIESEDPDRITALVRQLGLSGLTNENYVAGLRRALEGVTS